MVILEAPIQQATSLGDVRLLTIKRSKIVNHYNPRDRTIRATRVEDLGADTIRTLISVTIDKTLIAEDLAASFPTNEITCSLNLKSASMGIIAITRVATISLEFPAPANEGVITEMALVVPNDYILGGAKLLLEVISREDTVLCLTVGGFGWTLCIFGT